MELEAMHGCCKASVRRDCTAAPTLPLLQGRLLYVVQLEDDLSSEKPWIRAFAKIPISEWTLFPVPSITTGRLC